MCQTKPQTNKPNGQASRWTQIHDATINNVEIHLLQMPEQNSTFLLLLLLLINIYFWANTTFAAVV